VIARLGIGNQRYLGIDDRADLGTIIALARCPHELLKLGFDISERIVSRYLARRLPGPGDAAKNWLAFLKNHREAIAALDFFTVPTVSFRLLYCFFVIDHGGARSRTST